MNREERQYIEYRPQLGLSVNVRLILEDLGEDPEQIFEAPTEIMEASQNLASDVFELANAVTNQLNGLLDRAAKALNDDGASPVPLATYLNDPSPEDKAAFEAFHGGDINGKLEGELLPVLAGVKADVARATDYLNQFAYGGKADTDDPASVRAKEMKELEALVRKAISDPSGQDLSPVKAKSEVVQAMRDAVGVAGEFALRAEGLLNMTAADVLAGQSSLIVSQLAEAPVSAMASMASVSNTRFAQQAAQTASLIENIDRLGGEEVQQLLFDEHTNLSKLKAEALKTLAWMDSIDTFFDSSPMAGVIEGQLDTIEEVFDAHDEILEDMHKLSLLKSLQYEDLADALIVKETSRQTTKVVGSMQENFDFEDDNRQRQVNRFIDNTGINSKRL